jgi:hypothetical protein
VVGPAGRDGAGVCACASTDEATAVAPTTLAAFSKPRLVTVEALSRFDITSFQPAAWVKITTARMSRVTKGVSTPPLLRFWRLLPKERFTAYGNRAFLATVVSPNPGLPSDLQLPDKSRRVRVQAAQIRLPIVASPNASTKRAWPELLIITRNCTPSPDWPEGSHSRPNDRDPLCTASCQGPSDGTAPYDQSVLHDRALGAT